MPRTGSQVWSFFDKISGGKYVKCRLCGIELSFGGGLTGSMNNHIRLKHPTSTAKPSTSGTGASQSKLADFMHRKDCTPVRAEKISQLLAEMIAEDSLPISVVDGGGLAQSIIVPRAWALCQSCNTL